MKDITDIKNLEEFAKFFAKEIKPGMQIGLVGELGAGKTTFTSFLLSALGYQEEISSPSYVLCNEYRLPDLVVEHWDLYRLAGIPSELYEPVDNKSIRLIEWSDKFSEIEDALDMQLIFKIDKETEKRSVTQI